MIRAGIVGATGYTGSELLRLLLRHPDTELLVVTSRAEAGRPVSDYFPALRGVCQLEFAAADSPLLKDCDLVFFATPNGTAMQEAPALLDAGVRVIDLAADFRLRDPESWASWYGMTHACPERLPEAVYGLPEINREALREARLVANPGCYPTAVALGFLPLIESGLVDTGFLVADVKSGVSGAGRQAKTGLLMAEVGESFKAYSVAGHRHQPEICQTLTAVQPPGAAAINLTFVPHLVPMIRGIEATLYARLDLSAGHQDAEQLQSLFEKRYQNEGFVDVMPAGSAPETRSVRGTNNCRLAVTLPDDRTAADGRVVVVQSVIDNLVKGAAGQAIQNMNLMFGLAETKGLTELAWAP
ncbi:N-acetyl-gamma-glutamyl-phosphate reductase [Thiorhodovibrio frisius]|uniref:N-acetyl-gamma-glutamyl-phosphate reductase n=1 Tax=Thiorhodovibrio frisius TaxID=631362 RepID=H8Z5I9_9GAMM|nr:N-acetyl-gamma-glutamyl-phosphate reductase [Thiorhodovibrio frisius]EIC20559.1 N-acetyl-gamma-glutamyl-phosphate reductase, common form [Thiorhodovibrio frisius]WPL21307.1 N-acetyl-gamma-glutamyl-phosphate reductase [Thiorhodovibrio frisius]